jgi:hypothetical protein
MDQGCRTGNCPHPTESVIALELLSPKPMIGQPREIISTTMILIRTPVLGLYMNPAQHPCVTLTCE